MAKAIVYPDVRSVSVDTNNGTYYTVTFNRTSSIVKTGRIYTNLLDCQPVAAPYIGWSIQQTLNLTLNSTFDSEGAPNTYNIGVFTWSNPSITADFRYNTVDTGTLSTSECLNNPIQSITWSPFLFVSSYNKTVSYSGGSLVGASNKYYHKIVPTSLANFVIDIFSYKIYPPKCFEHLLIFYCNRRGGIDVITGRANSVYTYSVEEGQTVNLYPYQDVATNPLTYPRTKLVGAHRSLGCNFFFKANRGADLSQLLYSPEIYLYDTVDASYRRVFITNNSLEQSSGIYSIQLQSSYFIEN